MSDETKWMRDEAARRRRVARDWIRASDVVETPIVRHECVRFAAVENVAAGDLERQAEGAELKARQNGELARDAGLKALLEVAK